MEKTIYKSFPSNTTLDLKTFLNDPKINAELYAYLLSISSGMKDANGRGITYIRKVDFPTATKLGEKIHKCRQTVSKHLKYLIEKGYLIAQEDQYIILNPEDYYFKIPLDTLQYLLDTVKEEVVKVYIYLGVRYGTKPGEYLFTNKELCDHLGLNYQNNSGRITNILDALNKFGLINFSIIFDEQNHPYMKLTYFTTKCPAQNSIKELC